MVWTAIVGALSGIAGGLVAAGFVVGLDGHGDLLAFSGSLLGAIATIGAGYAALRGIREEMREQSDQFLATVASTEIDRIGPVIGGLQRVVSLANRVLEAEKRTNSPWLAIAHVFDPRAFVATKEKIEANCRDIPFEYRGRMVDEIYGLNDALFSYNENERSYTFNQSDADRVYIDAKGDRLKSVAAQHREAIRAIVNEAQKEIASLEAEHALLDTVKKRVLAAHLQSLKAGTEPAG